MTDYLGNEIKDGDEICFITVVKRQNIRFAGIIIGNKFIDANIPEMEDEPCFDKGEYLKVFEYHGTLAYKIETSEFTMTDIIPPMWFDSKTQIIAIKGVSDSESQYLNFIIK